MKTISAGMRTHLDQEVTALATCWIITREDSVIIRFTDHDEDITIGGAVYQSIGAYKRTAITSTDTLSVDNLDIEGLSGDLTLPREDLIVGIYDNADVKVFVTRWDGGTPSEIKMRRGRFGAVEVLPNGTFTVELRGIMQYLNHPFMSIYSATCLHQFGDEGCTVPVFLNQVQRSTVYAVGDGVKKNPSGSMHKVIIRDAWFQDGVSVSGSTGWRKFAEATIVIGGVLSVLDALTFDDGTNTPVQLIAGTDFTVGISAAADATTLHVAINAAAALDIVSFDDGLGTLTLLNSLSTPGTITEDVDAGGFIAITDFIAGDMTIGSGPGIGPFNGLQCLIGGNTTGIIVQDADILLSGVSVAAIDTGICTLDVHAWRLGEANEGTFIVEALNADLALISVLYTTGSEDINNLVEWRIRGVREETIPALTRFIRFKFIATLTGSAPIVQYFDNVYAWIFDPTGVGEIRAPYQEWMWVCETAGTTSVADSTYVEGSIGAKVVDGTVTFRSEEAWQRGASVISVTPGSSRVFRAEPQEYRAVNGWFDGGVVEFMTGKNAGGKMEIKSWIRDGSPTSSITRVENSHGVGAIIVFKESSHHFTNWNLGVSGIAYIHLGFNDDDLDTNAYAAEWDLSTLNYNGEFLDLTNPAVGMTAGARLHGLDRHTGYLYGQHRVAPSNIYRYVYDPATKSYITILNASPASAQDMLLNGWNEYSVAIRNASTGNQVVLSHNSSEMRAHNFPAMTYNTNFLPPVGGMTPGAWVTSPDNTKAWGTWGDSNNIRIYEYTLSSGGVVVQTLIDTLNISSFPGSSFLYISDSPDVYFDPITDQYIMYITTNSGPIGATEAHFFAYGFGSSSLNWTRTLPYVMNRIGWTHVQVQLNGQSLVAMDGGGNNREFLKIDIVTGTLTRFAAGGDHDIIGATSMWDDVSGQVYYSVDGEDAFFTMGMSREITVTIAPGTLELFLSLPFTIEAGDLFTITPGCDKSRLSCAILFDNTENFLGAPDIPGQDSLYAYPDAKT